MAVTPTREINTTGSHRFINQQWQKRERKSQFFRRALSKKTEPFLAQGPGKTRKKKFVPSVHISIIGGGPGGIGGDKCGTVVCPVAEIGCFLSAQWQFIGAPCGGRKGFDFENTPE
ncbi:MAG: hypothetical protein ABJC04_10715, partial [Verrucomicrobiota bacterium]